MDTLAKFVEFAISESDEKQLKGGIDWVAVCGSLYAYAGSAMLAGDQQGASAAWSSWNNMGCAYIA